jgi:hypothetical protein
MPTRYGCREAPDTPLAGCLRAGVLPYSQNPFDRHEARSGDLPSEAERNPEPEPPTIRATHRSSKNGTRRGKGTPTPNNERDAP